MSATEGNAGFLSLGQEGPRTAVLGASAAGRLQRTLLVHGPRGAGKGAFVEDLMALLLCGDPVAARRPCNACRGCRDARARTHPDLVMGSPDVWREMRSTGESIVGAARRWLLDSAGTPIAGDRRVIVIEGIDHANEQAQNALLKALEEPSDRHVYLLVADDLGHVLPTVVSRALLLRIGPVPRRTLVAWLMDHERLPADQADALARTAEGLAGRAIGYAREPQAVEWRRRIQAELLGLLTRGRADRLGSVRELLDQVPGVAVVAEPVVAADEGVGRPSSAAQRSAALAVIDAWQALARDLLVTSLGRPGLAPSAQLLDDLPAAASRLRPAELVAFIALAERVRDGLLQNAAPRLALEVAMLRWPFAGAAA